jgi:sec-independent protein translocase protein TatA
MYQSTVLEFLNMGGGEIMLILAVVLLLFGGKKLPELARGLGKGIRDFKDASEGVKREIHRNINAVDITDDLNTTVSNKSSTTTAASLDEQMYGTAAPSYRTEDVPVVEKVEEVSIAEHAAHVPGEVKSEQINLEKK